MTKLAQDNATLAAYRVFETLKFLVKNPASVDDIVKYLEGLEPVNPKGYSKAVVYKYITTLKFAGINIVNHKCKYEVQDLPFKINFSEDNIKALAILNEVLENIPEQNLSAKFTEFFYQMKMRYSLDFGRFEEKKNLLKESINISTPNIFQLKILQRYEKYCKDKIRLQISYINLFGEKESSTFEPLEAKFEDEQVILLAFCTKTNTFFELNSKQILDVRQTPSICRAGFFASTTVYKLKGKLSKRYTLRYEEQTFGLDANEELTVANKNEPKDKLFLRLMRYADLCEVSSSKKDRDYMVSLIDDTLSNYEGA